MKKEKEPFDIDPLVIVFFGLLFFVIVGDFILAIGYFYSFIPSIIHPKLLSEYLALCFVSIAVFIQGIIALSWVIDFLYGLIPNPNEKFIRLAHVFGFMKDKEPIADVTVNISPSFYTEKENELIQFADEKKLPDYIAQDLKDKIYQILKSDPKLEARCRKVHQVWVTFSKEKESTIMKMCYYKNGVLYYPCIEDRKLYESLQKDFKCADCEFETNSLESLGWHKSECKNK
jgi:hypothetical protein